MTKNVTNKILFFTSFGLLATTLYLLYERRNKAMDSNENLKSGAVEKASIEKKAEETVNMLLSAKKEERVLRPAEKEALANHIKGLTETELRYILNYIPIEIIFTHIGEVLEKNKRFTAAIQNAMFILE